MEQEMQRLASMGALRIAPSSRLSGDTEYVHGDFAEAIAADARDMALDLDAALRWIEVRARSRPAAWARRLAHLQAQGTDLAAAAANARVAAASMHALGALPEAVDCYELSRNYCLGLLERGAQRDAATGLSKTARGLAPCLTARHEYERASDRAREAIEELRGLDDLTEADWYKLGVPLLSLWAQAETEAGRAKGVVEPLEQQIEAITAAQSEMTAAYLPPLRLALGSALLARDRVVDALETWRQALNELPADPDFPLTADLSMRIADAYRRAEDGEQAVTYARRGLAAA
ncbi:MAG: hypothetical protein ABGW95_04160, partial [Candidatus Poseidoniia archaeon]